MFANVLGMANASAYDVLVGKMVTVPHSKFTMWGFPCDDVSLLNPGAADHNEVVAGVSGRTGTLFHACMDYLDATRDEVEASASENVVGLAKILSSKITGHRPYNSNLDFCFARYAASRWWSIALQLDSGEFLKPIGRPRIWMPLVPMEKLGALTVDDANAIALEVSVGPDPHIH